MPTITKKYGYKVGDKVISLIELSSENMKVYPAGTAMRIVAIAPKVTMAKFYAKKYPKVYDNKEYFFNAVLFKQDNDYSNRIRADFITIKKA